MVPHGLLNTRLAIPFRHQCTCIPASGPALIDAPINPNQPWRTPGSLLLVILPAPTATISPPIHPSLRVPAATPSMESVSTMAPENPPPTAASPSIPPKPKVPPQIALSRLTFPCGSLSSGTRQRVPGRQGICVCGGTIPIPPKVLKNGTDNLFPITFTGSNSSQGAWSSELPLSPLRICRLPIVSYGVRKISCYLE